MGSGCPSFCECVYVRVPGQRLSPTGVPSTSIWGLQEMWGGGNVRSRPGTSRHRAAQLIWLSSSQLIYLPATRLTSHISRPPVSYSLPSSPYNSLFMRARVTSLQFAAADIHRLPTALPAQPVIGSGLWVRLCLLTCEWRRLYFGRRLATTSSCSCVSAICKLPAATIIDCTSECHRPLFT